MKTLKLALILLLHHTRRLRLFHHAGRQSDLELRPELCHSCPSIVQASMSLKKIISALNIGKKSMSVCTVYPRFQVTIECEVPVLSIEPGQLFRRKFRTKLHLRARRRHCKTIAARWEVLETMLRHLSKILSFIIYLTRQLHVVHY